MAYFPFYFELKDKRGIVIGGGKISLEKVARLSSFDAKLTVIAPEIISELSAYENENIKFINRKYELSDLKDAYYVIAATDDEEINSEICEYCRRENIPVNVVDDQDKCDFIFPSVIQRGPLVIGVSSSGASPQVAMNIRKQIEEILPDNIEVILDYLSRIRPIVKSTVSDASVRHKAFKKIAGECMIKGRPLSKDEYEYILSGLKID